MSKRKFVMIGLILVVVIVFGMIVKNAVNNQDSFLSPALKNTNQPILSSPLPTLAPTPKVFKYDRSTDLKKELDLINPQILESDFD